MGLRGEKVWAERLMKCRASTNRVEGRFGASKPNQLWVVDFTYVSNWAGTAVTAIRDRCVLAAHCWVACRWSDADCVTVRRVKRNSHGLCKPSVSYPIGEHLWL
jgi:hypothetical protein